MEFRCFPLKNIITKSVCRANGRIVTIDKHMNGPRALFDLNLLPANDKWNKVEGRRYSTTVVKRRRCSRGSGGSSCSSSRGCGSSSSPHGSGSSKVAEARGPAKSLYSKD